MTLWSSKSGVLGTCTNGVSESALDGPSALRADLCSAPRGVFPPHPATPLLWFSVFKTILQKLLPLPHSVVNWEELGDTERVVAPDPGEGWDTAGQLTTGVQMRVN